MRRLDGFFNTVATAVANGTATLGNQVQSDLLHEQVANMNTDPNTSDTLVNTGSTSEQQESSGGDSTNIFDLSVSNISYDSSHVDSPSIVVDKCWFTHNSAVHY
jgi:hypothetical protein